MSSGERTGTKGEVTIVETSRAQQTTARRAAESRATVPDLELLADVDMSDAIARPAGEQIATTALLVRALGLALRAFPRANGSYRDGRFELYGRVNVGVALETEDAFVHATVFDADIKPVVEIDQQIGLLAARARDGTLTPPELAGATATVSDLGVYGVTSATAVITPPHAIALTAGAIREVPVVHDGGIVPGHTMSITLACDHRILYGAVAASFLARIKSELEEAADL